MQLVDLLLVVLAAAAGGAVALALVGGPLGLLIPAALGVAFVAIVVPASDQRDRTV